MTTVDRISQQVNHLPESFQKQVLDYIEFLVSKTKRENSRHEDLEWFSLSVTSAMRDMDDEDGPIYDKADLKEKWK